jgi:transcriptional regulator with XRE-family HTH domain
MTASVDPPPARAGEADSFAQLIARRRRQLGLSQRDLADLLCDASGRPTLTRHEVSRYERGLRLPRGDVLAALAACLDLPLAQLRVEVAKQRDSRTPAHRPPP